MPCDTDGMFRVIKASGTIDGKEVDLTRRISSFDPPRVRIRTALEEKSEQVSPDKSKK